MKPLPGRPATASVMILSRVWEQSLLGLAALVLARRLEVSAFAPVSALLIVNSLSVTMSDLGLGLAVLRLGPDEQADLLALRRVRVCNLVVLVAGATSGWMIGGSAGTVIGWGAAVWATSAEAFIRKSGAMRLGEGRQAAVAELIGTALFFAAVAFASPRHAVAITGAGLVLKHVVESACIRTWRATFARGGRRGGQGDLWLTQVLAFAVANVDYVVVAPLLGSSAFAVYVLAFRVASVLPAQVASVTTRISLAELAQTTDPAERQAAYDRFTLRLFVGGAAGVVLTLALLPLLPEVLGERWRPSVGVAVVLSFSIPWRLVMGIAGTLAISAGETTRLVRWEATRLVVVAGVYLAAAAVSLRVLSVAVTVVAVLAAAVLHRFGARVASVTPPRAMWVAAVVTVCLTVAVAPFVSGSL